MLNIFLTASTDTTASTGFNWQSLIMPGIMIVVLIAVFYFMMIRPQKKREKEEANMRNSIGPGDEVTTIGGIVGRVLSVADETVVIGTSGDCTKLRILKSSIARVDKKVGETEKKEEK